MDLLNLAGDERLDFGDLTFALNEAPPGLLAEITGKFLTAPGQNSIITGFRPSGSGQGPVQIGDSGVANVALLGQRLSGVVTQGVFSAVGPATQSLAITTLPANTYGIFVRFNRLPGQTQTRKFLNKSSPASEYSQLQSTRLVASWECRLEVTAPSAEWFKIGQAVITSAGSGQGNTVVVTDQRPLYFEGSPSSSFAPTWGSASDRASDRSTANTGNLQRQLDALRQCIVDIKGRGLATWYQPNISGLQIGSAYGLTAAPTADQLSVGDDNFFLGLQQDGNFSAKKAVVSLDSNDRFEFSRTVGSIYRLRGGSPIFNMSSSGSASFGTGDATSLIGASKFTVLDAATTVGQRVYTLAGVTTQTGPARLGLVSTSSQQASVDFAKDSTQSPQAQVAATWTSSSATLTLFANNTQFLSATNTGASSTMRLDANTLNISSSGLAISSSGGSFLYNNRINVPGGSVWAAGVVSLASGSQTIRASLPPGQTASVSAAGAVCTITFGVGVPSGMSVLVLPVAQNDGIARIASYIWGGLSLSIFMYNTNNDPSLASFSFQIFYGGS